MATRFNALLASPSIDKTADDWMTVDDFNQAFEILIFSVEKLRGNAMFGRSARFSYFQSPESNI